MARRRAPSKKPRTRRSKPKFNATNLVVGGLVANSITQGMFNTNLREFVTGDTSTASTPSNAWGADGGNVLSLPELLGMSNNGRSVSFGGNYGAGDSLGQALTRNFKANWGKMAFGVVVIPMVANVATKLLRKPLLTPINKGLKMAKLDVKV